MRTRNVKDLLVEIWEGKLRAAGARNPHALALELAAIAEAHGIRLARPALLHDPAADWKPTPQLTAAAQSADHASNNQAVKALIAQRPACPDRQDGS